MTQGSSVRTVDLERTGELALTFPPRAETTIELELVSKGVPYWSRPDLGIAPRDVRLDGETLSVTVHSLGAVAARPSRVTVTGRDARVLATAGVGALEAPADLRPRRATVRLRIPRGTDMTGARVTVESSDGVPEITRKNNTVTLGK